MGQEGGCLDGGGAWSGEPGRWGAQNFALFPSPIANFVIPSLSGGLFRGIEAAVLGHGTPKVCVSASLGSFCFVPAPAAPSSVSWSGGGAVWRGGGPAEKRSSASRCGGERSGPVEEKKTCTKKKM